jgi:hypothetical protein
MNIGMSLTIGMLGEQQYASTWTTLLLQQAQHLEDHIQAVSAVFEVAERLDLYFKPEKCTFHAPHMDYLGVILEKGITHMDPIKIAGIKNWPTPTKVKDIRSFLGFCNFYRPFIRGFAHIARPLNKLTRKDIEWTWTEQHQKAFKNYKQSHQQTSTGTPRARQTI